MNRVTKEQSAKLVGFKLIMILIIGTAAFSSAIKELNHMTALANNVWHLSADVFGAGVTIVNAKGPASAATCKNIPIAGELAALEDISFRELEFDGDVSVNLPTARSESKVGRTNRTAAFDLARHNKPRVIRHRRTVDEAGRQWSELVLKTLNTSIALHPIS